MKITKVKLKRRDADILAENLVEYNQAQIKTPIPAGETVAVMEDGVFEQFTRHPRGKIVPAGAFTHVVDAGDDFFHLTLGRYCSVARGIRVVNGHHPLHSVTSNPYHYAEYYRNNLPEELRYTGPVETFRRSYGRGKVGNDVWLGAYCIIRSGLSIGDGAVVSSGSVIVKDVPPYAIVGGNPAKIIRYRFPDEIVARFQALKWWSYTPEDFRDIDMFDVEGFLTEMERRKDLGQLRPFAPKRFKFVAGELTELD